MADVEALTQDYGREIFARLDHNGPILFSPSWFDDRLMEWTMGNEAVKLQLFRFVDVLPMLSAANGVTRHLHEYFAEASPHLPGWARLGLRWLPQARVAELNAAAPTGVRRQGFTFAGEPLRADLR